MSTTPADRPTAPSRPANDLARTRRVPIRGRVVSGDARARVSDSAAAWTTHREMPLVCARCRGSFVLSYKYRFVDGLVATLIRCPAAGCGDRFEYYLPVNAFDVVAAAAGVTPPHEA